MVLSIAAAAALAAQIGSALETGPARDPRTIDACLTADLTVEEPPQDLWGLVRRWPDGTVRRHLAWRPQPTQPHAAGSPGLELLLVYGISGEAAGPLVQLSVTGVVIFDAAAPTELETFRLFVDGEPLADAPWPEYAADLAAYRSQGSPRFSATEKWVVWNERGAPLRDRLNAGARELEVRLVAADGETIRSAAYDMAHTPLAQKAAVRSLIAHTQESTCPQHLP